MWVHTLPAPRTVLVTLRERTPHHLKQFSASSIVTLSVNKESRAETLREYGIVLFAALSASLVVGKSDTLKIIGNELVEGSSKFSKLFHLVNKAIPGGCAEIENMEITSLPHSKRWVNVTELKLILGRFSGLKKLNALLGLYGNREAIERLLIAIFSSSAALAAPEIVVEYDLARTFEETIAEVEHELKEQKKEFAKLEALVNSHRPSKNLPNLSTHNHYN